MEVVNTYRYQTLKQIDEGRGQNSLGVWLARDPQLQREIAVKQMSKAELGSDPDAYYAEARRVSDASHPNVVPILVAVDTPDEVALCMPYYKNGCLASRIQSGPLSLLEARRFMCDALAGIGSIHASGTIHFDIKPSNILVSDRGVAQIADFGQAREIGPNGVTMHATRIYAPATPPEAFTNGRRGTVESDIYQAGMLFYRLLNGDKVFNEEYAYSEADLVNRICRGRFPRRDAFLPHVPDRAKRIVRKAMNVDPSKRFTSASEMANAIATIQITHNWHMSQPGTHVTCWTAPRQPQPDLQVTLTNSGSSLDVAVHTVRDGKRRRHRVHKPFSVTSEKDAIRELTQLFSAIR